MMMTCERSAAMTPIVTGAPVVLPPPIRHTLQCLDEGDNYELGGEAYWNLIDSGVSAAPGARPGGAVSSFSPRMLRPRRGARLEPKRKLFVECKRRGPN